MNKKARKILITLGILLVVLFIGLILVISLIFHEVFVKPTNNAMAEAKSRAAYLLQIPDKTMLKKVGEAGMSETLDNNNHCYAYAFQGTTDYSTAKNSAISLLNKAGFSIEPTTVIDIASAYKVRGKANDGWTTQLQVLNNTALVKVTEGVIDNPVSTKAQVGQVLISGQVCNI